MKVPSEAPVESGDEENGSENRQKPKTSECTIGLAKP